MAHLSLLDPIASRDAPFTSNNDAARVHGPVGRTRSNGTLTMKVDDGPSSSSPVPELTERVFRSALCALHAAHAILTTARPDLRRARVEIFATSGKLVGWFAVTDPDRCSLEIRDVVTEKAIVFPAPVAGPGTKPPSDDPMLKSDPKILVPTGTQGAEIARLVAGLRLSDEQLSALLWRKFSVRTLADIPDYHTADHLIGVLNALGRIGGKAGSVDPLFDDAVGVVLKSGKGSTCEVQRKLGVGFQRASRLVEAMTTAGILGPHCGAAARKVLIGLKETDPRGSEEQC
jgi:hypothetical protein